MAPWRTILRCGAAILLIGTVGLYAAPVIRSGGYGGWLLALVGCVVCPFTVALVAGRWHVLFGVLTAGAVQASFFVNDRWIEPARRGYGTSWNIEIAFAVVALGLSLLASLAAAAVEDCS